MLNVFSKQKFNFELLLISPKILLLSSSVAIVLGKRTDDILD